MRRAARLTPRRRRAGTRTRRVTGLALLGLAALPNGLPALPAGRTVLFCGGPLHRQEIRSGAPLRRTLSWWMRVVEPVRVTRRRGRPTVRYAYRQRFWGRYRLYATPFGDRVVYVWEGVDATLGAPEAAH